MAKRYVDVDRVIEKIIDVSVWFEAEDEQANRACRAIRGYIEQLPSADVRENVHGEWTLVTDRYGANGEYVWKCSSCKKMTICKGDFCPNCGCDMRGRRIDGEEIH